MTKTGEKTKYIYKKAATFRKSTFRTPPYTAQSAAQNSACTTHAEHLFISTSKTCTILSVSLVFPHEFMHFTTHSVSSFMHFFPLSWFRFVDFPALELYAFVQYTAQDFHSSSQMLLTQSNQSIAVADSINMIFVCALLFAGRKELVRTEWMHNKHFS